MDKEDIEKLEALMEKVGAGVTADQRSQGITLLNAYKKDPSKETFTPLYQNYKGLIYDASKRNTYGSPLPASAHWAYATQSFLDAVRTHDPKQAPFHIHAYTTILNKGKRLNLKYQNIGYIPEARATKYQLFNNALTILRELHGREPSTLEIADELKWSPKMVETMRNEVRTSYVMDEGKSEIHSLVKSDKARQALQDIQYSLIPAHQLVLEHAVGLNGKSAMVKPSGGPDLLAISKATKLSVPKIRSALKTITRKFKQYDGKVLTPEELEETDEPEVGA